MTYNEQNGLNPFHKARDVDGLTSVHDKHAVVQEYKAFRNIIFLYEMYN